MGLTYRDETHSSEIGKDGDNEQRDGVEETDEHEEYPAHCLLTPDFSSGFIQVLPDLPGYETCRRDKESYVETYDILGVGSKSNSGSLDTLVTKHIGDNVGVRDSSHRGETVILCLAIVDLGAILLDETFCPLELRASQTGCAIRRGYR